MKHGREYFKSDRKRKEALMQGKEERTHEHVGHPKYDASFFKDASKNKEWRGKKY